MQSRESSEHKDPDALHGEILLKETDDVAAAVLVRERWVPDALA